MWWRLCHMHLVLIARVDILISSRSGSTQICYYLVSTHIFHIQRLSRKPRAKGGIIIPRALVRTAWWLTEAGNVPNATKGWTNVQTRGSVRHEPPYFFLSYLPESLFFFLIASWSLTKFLVRGITCLTFK